jgi:hypothetical protein
MGCCSSSLASGPEPKRDVIIELNPINAIELKPKRESLPSEWDSDGIQLNALQDAFGRALCQSLVTREELALKTQDQMIQFIKETLALHLGRHLRETFHPNEALADEETVWEKPQLNRNRASTRSKYRQKIEDIIGPAPPERTWKDDHTHALKEGMEALGEDITDKKFAYRLTPESHHHMCAEIGQHAAKMKAGYTSDEADCLGSLFCSPIAYAVGKAIEEGEKENEEEEQQEEEKKSNRYAAITHRGAGLIAKRAFKGEVAPRCFMHLVCEGRGLADRDSQWKKIEEPDANGFLGMTSYAPLWLAGEAREKKWDPEGLKEKIAGEWKVINSPVICFESAEPGGLSGRVLHSAVQEAGEGEKRTWVLPPLTLLTVVDVKGPGEWEYLEGKRMNQKLITVRPTYMLPAKSHTTRAKFRQSITDAIGPVPKVEELKVGDEEARETGKAVKGQETKVERPRVWREEHTLAVLEGMNAIEQDVKDEQFAYRLTPKTHHAGMVENGQFQEKVAIGYTEEEADCLGSLFCSPIAYAVGKAIEEKSDRYAAITHKGAEIIIQRALSVREERGNEGLAPACYMHLVGEGRGLADRDPRWKKIEEPDANGFPGMTSYAPLWLAGQAREKKWDPEGLKEKIGGEWKVINSPVICFESAEPSGVGGRALHSAVQEAGEGEKRTWVLPPLTLLKVVDVKGAGEWEYLEGKRMNQKLITVRPTYMLPVKPRNDATLRKESKFASDHSILSYGHAADMVRGEDDIIGSLVLTMEQEWRRNEKWADWKGIAYSAWEEWEYVQGKALGSEKRGSGVGEHDYGHEGWTLKRFKQEANNYVEDQADSLQLDPDEYQLLTLDEVIALRLYTGPGYTPVNKFLREVSKVSPDWRGKLSRMHLLSYSSTVRHLTRAIRKLVRVRKLDLPSNPSGPKSASTVEEDGSATVEEDGSADKRRRDKPNTVYRAVRGELGEAFWLTDDFGAVTALDFAFMSASMKSEVCEEYMTSSDSNVLWAIECRAEDEEGFHSGADVSMVSQFPKEREILFPPLTMLSVHPEDAETKGKHMQTEMMDDGGVWASSVERQDSLQRATSATPGFKRPARHFTKIHVTPTFI